MRDIKLKSIIAAAVMIFFTSLPLFSQKTDALSAYSPYSLFGFGQLDNQGTAYNMSMGGIGVAMRDNRYINYLNPAAITARDTLSFMMDVSINEKNIYGTDGIAKSAYNVVNLQNIAMSFPIWRSSAFVIGIQPFSNVGYKFVSKETSSDILSQVGDVTYNQYGTGSVYQTFLGAGATFWKRLSIGAEALFYFGNIDRHSNVIFNSSPAYNDILTGWSHKIHAFSGKFGIQYSQPFKKIGSALTIGGTYRLGTDIKGHVSRYAYSTGAKSSKKTFKPTFFSNLWQQKHV